MLKIALYQPDIPQNLGAMIRLCACLGVGLDVIEPCGFPWNEKKIRQSGMDYLTQVNLTRHNSWDKFTENVEGRIILMTTKTDQSYIEFEFKPNDILLAGSESNGVPEEIHQQLVHRITIPMAGDARSLNIVNATSMIAGEAMRQTKWKI